MSRPTSESRQRAEARRERLRGLMDRLEATMAESPLGDPAAWRTSVRAVVDELATELEDHVAETEGARGFFDELLQAAPRLSHRIDELRNEHPKLHARLEELRSQLDHYPSDGDDPASVRVAGTELLSALIRHRQAGADLIYEAYWVDLSAND